jgi:twitching motility protein PilT
MGAALLDRSQQLAKGDPSVRLLERRRPVVEHGGEGGLVGPFERDLEAAVRLQAQRHVRQHIADTHGFAPALKHILRQDPDIVLIGEMRDLETIEAALVVAETGHLVFSTLHTNSAVQTINRVIDVFPPYQQEQVRAQLSLVLQGVVSQQLLPRADNRGRCLAAEVMIPNAAIRNLVREAKVHQIYSQMQVGQQKWGMQTMNQSLLDLYLRRLVTADEALGHATEPEELKTMLAQNPPAGRTATIRR